MRKNALDFALFLMCLTLPLTATSQVVDIPDPDLLAAIESELGIAPGSTITAGQMAGLTELFRTDSAMSNLTGLEYANNLTFLHLERTNIADISAVEKLTNLAELNLSDNNIEDLSPLVANTGLGGGDLIVVDRNPLNFVSINTHIPDLESRGVEVYAENLIPFLLNNSAYSDILISL